MIQTLVVVALIALAGIYLARRAWGRLRYIRQATGGGSSCGSDCGCGPAAGKSRE